MGAARRIPTLPEAFGQYVPQDPAATLADVALRAGVSRVAVAKVLLGSGGPTVRVGRETAARIHQVAETLRYTPNWAARQLAGKRSHLIGVIIDTYSAPVHFERLSLLEREAAALGYRFLVGQSHDGADWVRDYIEDFRARGLDGAICMAHQYPGREREIAEAFSQLPHGVFVGKPGPGSGGLAYVAIDLGDGVRQAFEHVWSRGRRRVAIVLFNMETPSMIRRYKGYRRALEVHGLAPDPTLVCGGVPNQPWRGEPSTETMLPYVSDLILHHKADAILAPNDRAAVVVIKALRHLGCRVPDDVAVAGFDNIEIAALYEPPLTTVDRRNKELARSAVRLLVRLIEGRDVPAEQRRITIKPELIVRGST